MKQVRYDDPELGPTRRCPRCEEYWPLDAEFWVRDRGRADGFGPYCRACTAEWVAAKRARQRELVPA